MYQITLHPSLYMTQFQSKFPSKVTRQYFLIWSDSATAFICESLKMGEKIIRVEFVS
jgi:hypothetical protein